MKLVARIKGGLGNQLFCYAAARRLAIINNCDLLMDNISGFSRDTEYKRQYRLGRFSIPCSIANASERFWPFERLRRGISKTYSRFMPFEKRKYIEELGAEFNSKLLHIRLQNELTTIDGLWQSEAYFKDIEDTIRSDLIIMPPNDTRNIYAQNWIKKNKAIAIHVRWFGGVNSAGNVPLNYYKNALELICKKIPHPYFVLFSDNPVEAAKFLDLNNCNVMLADWNNSDAGEVDDLWLMSQCEHFIIANSTFSWWGAWLGAIDLNSVVIFPRLSSKKDLWAWDYYGQMPLRWIPILVD